MNLAEQLLFAGQVNRSVATLFSRRRTTRSPTARHLACALVGLAVGELVAVAQAAPPSAVASIDEVAKARDEARGLAQRGLARIDAGDFREGIRLIELAEERFHATTHLLYLAQAHASLGEIARAARIYAGLLTEALPDYAPVEFREAQQIARQELEAIVARVARIRIEHDRGDARRFELVLDGERMVQVPAELYVDPGTHELTLTADGEKKQGQVLGRAGESVTLKLVFGPRPTEIRNTPGPPEPSSASPLIVAGAALLGLGGTAIISGAVTGGLSWSLVSELADNCPSKQGCDPIDRNLADQARTLGNASTASLVTGGALAVAGVVMLLWPRPAPSGATPVATSKAREVLPLIGPGWIGIKGTF